MPPGWHCLPARVRTDPRTSGEPVSCPTCGTHDQRGAYCVSCGTELLALTQPVLRLETRRKPPVPPAAPPAR